jgi:SHS2 domain-containing protein
MISSKYEVIDIFGDAGIKAFGADCAEAWGNAGIGMYSLITELEQVGERKTLEIEVTSTSPESLLVKYLNELIFHFDTYNFIGKRIEVTEFSESFIRAKVHGEEFDPRRHEQRLLLKAATYHNIKVDKSEGRCEVEVIFDI